MAEAVVCVGSGRSRVFCAGKSMMHEPLWSMFEVILLWVLEGSLNNVFRLLTGLVANMVFFLHFLC